MYEQYETMEESGYARSHLQSRQDFILSSRGLKKSPGWVFISRKADIAIVLVLLLVSGLGVMWFISQLPLFLETASAHYLWAKELYATWGTPSMRWLFINLVVGVILATSGLLSAFGGDGGQEAGLEGYDKGRVYGSSHEASYSAEAVETRFNGAGYVSPVYNPYIEPAKSALDHEHSFRGWSGGAEEHVPERDTEEEIQESEPPVVEADTAPAAATAAGDTSREIPMSSEISPPQETSTASDISLPEEMPASTDLPALENAQPELLESNNISTERGIEIISKVYDPVSPADETSSDDGNLHRMHSDSSVQLAPVNEHAPENSPPRPEVLHKSHTFTIGRVVRRDQLMDFIEPLSRKLEGIGRKVRLDPVRSSNTELVVNQPREILAPPPVEVRKSLSVEQVALAEAAPPLLLPAQQVRLSEAVTHRRRHSADLTVPVTHHRRLSSESVPPTESNYAFLAKQATTLGESTLKQPLPAPAALLPPPSTPLPRQRSIVYPPALLSQDSIQDEDTSPPPSPPMEEAIPPPPPPHLKLPPPLQVPEASSMTSSEELPSFKFYVPPPLVQDAVPPEESAAQAPQQPVVSNKLKKPATSKRSRPPLHIPATSSSDTGDLESSSVTVQEDRPLSSKHRKSSTDGHQEIEEVSASAPERPESSSPKNDDLHQKIEDFLARFHENWRLQRQESLARYKKRLVELDK